MNSGYGLHQFVSSPSGAGGLPSIFAVPETTLLSTLGEIQVFILLPEQHNCVDLVY
jgi:hypothetical protein